MNDSPHKLHQPWSWDTADVPVKLDVRLDQGLHKQEVRRRQHKFGLNQLREAKQRSLWSILVDQFKSLIVGLLAAAAITAAVFGDWTECGAIIAVILLNALIGFVTEWRAIRSMEALQHLSGTQAVVRRQGKSQKINAVDLVPGDVLLLEAGDSITADARLVEASKLQADESALTGESLPVSKTPRPIDAETILAERRNMLFKGTFVTRGSAAAVVVHTGMQTELGNISALVDEAGDQDRTPLQKRLDRLGHQLVWVTLGITVMVVVLGVIRQKELWLMIETGVALAVAAIPEGLPIVATIALARGMLRMARRNALIRRLSAVETLGATNIICTDKTGTLTENAMTVQNVLLADADYGLQGEHLVPDNDGDEASRETLQQVLETGALCNNAELTHGERENGNEQDQTHRDENQGPLQRGVGDPLELALLEAARRQGIERSQLVGDYPEVKEVAFDPEQKMMATYHSMPDDSGQIRVAVKGAPEAVLDACTDMHAGGRIQALDDEARKRWLDRNQRLAEIGLRIIALATKQVDSTDTAPYENLELLAFVGLHDPPRQDVRAAMQACQQAGIRVVMVTGDQPVTALNIARSVGIEGLEDDDPQVITGSSWPRDASGRDTIAKANVLARVSPKQKLDLIDIHQRRGLIVAMTGDGVNDAPVLQKADIGIAMGRRGTQVAREAADMVLEDDAFPTIVVAVQQGRIIFDNIRKFVVYLLSCNVSEVAVVGLASLLGWPLPVLPLQILFLNLVTDVFPALALGVNRGDATVMKRPPRDPSESILPVHLWRTIGFYAGLITVAVLGSLWFAQHILQYPTEQAITVSFLTLATAQLWHVFNMRSAQARLLVNEITGNPFVWGALALCTVLLLLAVYFAPLAHVLDVEPIDYRGWLTVLIGGLLPLVVGSVIHLVKLMADRQRS